MDLNEVLVFTRVVEAGSFTAAARELEMPKSTVSRKIAELEDRLGARLLQRTTRKLHLTDVGDAFYGRCKRIVAELEEAELVVADMQAAPRGRLRITTPLDMPRLWPLIADFSRRYPEVFVEVLATDRIVDLLEQGFDVAVRVGKLADSTLHARRLALGHAVVVAAPSFLRRRATPKVPSDLDGAECVEFTPNGSRWQLRDSGGDTVDVTLRPQMRSNDFGLVQAAAIAGVGFAMLPEDRCAEDLRARRLRRVLRGWCSPPIELHVVYPSTRYLAPAVRAFVDHVRTNLG